MLLEKMDNRVFYQILLSVFVKTVSFQVLLETTANLEHQEIEVISFFFINMNKTNLNILGERGFPGERGPSGLPGTQGVKGETGAQGFENTVKL